MDGGGSLWTLVTILGPIALAAAVIYGVVNWRRRSAVQDRAADRQTDRLYGKQ